MQAKRSKPEPPPIETVEGIGKDFFYWVLKTLLDHEERIKRLEGPRIEVGP